MSSPDHVGEDVKSPSLKSSVSCANEVMEITKKNMEMSFFKIQICLDNKLNENWLENIVFGQFEIVKPSSKGVLNNHKLKKWSYTSASCFHGVKKVCCTAVWCFHGVEKAFCTAFGVFLDSRKGAALCLVFS